MTREKIIGACLVDPAAAAYVVENSGDGMFNGLTLMAFHAIKRLYAIGTEITFRAVVAAAAIPAEQAMAWLADADPATIANDVESLKKAIFMEAFRAQVQMVETSYASGHDVSSVFHVMAAKMNQDIAEIEQDRSASMAELIVRGHKRSTENQEKGVTIIGLPTKWSSLNRMTEGFVPGLHIVAARPSTGKTTFSGEFIRDQAMRGVKTCFISLEMDKQRVADKVAGNALGLNDLNLAKGMVSQDDLDGYLLLSTQPWTQRIEFLQPPSSKLEAVKTAIYKAAGMGCKVIIIDHFHLVYIEGFRGAPEQAYSTIARDTSRLAYDLKIPVLFLAQVNREVDKRPDKRPLMSDIKYASTIEEVCETVIALYRPSIYKINEDENGIPYPDGYMELIVRKTRDVGTGGIVELVKHKNQLIEMEEYLRLHSQSHYPHLPAPF